MKYRATMEQVWDVRKRATTVTPYTEGDERREYDDRIFEPEAVEDTMAWITNHARDEGVTIEETSDGIDIRTMRYNVGWLVEVE